MRCAQTHTSRDGGTTARKSPAQRKSLRSGDNGLFLKLVGATLTDKAVDRFGQLEIAFADLVRKKSSICGICFVPDARQANLAYPGWIRTALQAWVYEELQLSWRG